jgi:hypothetical protein
MPPGPALVPEIVALSHFDWDRDIVRFNSGELAVSEIHREKLVRGSAPGKIPGYALHQRGCGDYISMPGALDELGLRPPVVPIKAPNVGVSRRGRAPIREASLGQGF